MSDLLTLDDLEVWTRIGVPDGERSTEQRLLVSVTLATDTTAIAAHDSIDPRTDYAKLASAIIEAATKERRTIERFAEDIAAITLRETDATSVTVLVKKFALPQAKNVTLSITRTR